MIAASMLFLYNIFYIITQSFMTEYIRTKETQIWQDQLLELYSWTGSRSRRRRMSRRDSSHH